MQTLKHYLLLFSALICSSVYVNAQYDNYNADYTDIYPGRRIFIDYNERFSTAKYKGRNTSYTTPDGTQVEVKSYGRTSTVEVFERPPLPSIHIIYKEFFANGKLKQMGVFLPIQLKIGKWFESDEQGNGFIVD